MRKYVGIVAATLLLLTPTQSLAGEPLKDTIQARNDEWSAAFNAGDAAALDALYQADAVLLAPGGGPIHGSAAIADALSGLFGALQNLKLVTEDVRPAGDEHVIEIGRILYELSAPDGAKTLFTGNYVVVWQRGQDGAWRLFRDIFNERHTAPIAE